MQEAEVNLLKQEQQKMMKDLDNSLTALRTITRNMVLKTLVEFGLLANPKDYYSRIICKDT